MSLAVLALSIGAAIAALPEDPERSHPKTIALRETPGWAAAALAIAEKPDHPARRRAIAVLAAAADDPAIARRLLAQNLPEARAAARRITARHELRARARPPANSPEDRRALAALAGDPLLELAERRRLLEDLARLPPLDPAIPALVRDRRQPAALRRRALDNVILRAPTRQALDPLLPHLIGDPQLFPRALEHAELFSDPGHKPLLALLEDEGDDDDKIRACAFLARTRWRPAGPLLLEISARKNAPIALRAEALRTLAVNAFLAANDLARRLVDLLRSADDPQRPVVMRALETVARPAAINALFEGYDFASRDERLLAVQAAAALRSPAAARHLRRIALNNEEDTTIRALAAAGLGECGAPALARLPLGRLLEARSPILRQAAIRALARPELADDAVRAALRPLITDPDPAARRQAIAALGAIGGEAEAALLLERLQAPRDPLESRALILALARREHRPAAAAIAALDTRGFFLDAALRYFQAVPCPQAPPFLIELLKHPELQTRKKAWDLLRLRLPAAILDAEDRPRLTRYDPAFSPRDRQEAVDAWRAWWTRNKDRLRFTAGAAAAKKKP